jgi:long-chain fatty acid transport protein
MRNLIVATAALLVPAAALAGGYVVPNINARDMAMSGSAQAAQDDAAATYALPAALARLDGLSFSVGGSLIDFRSTWTDPANSANQVTMIPKGAFPPAIYLSYGMPLSNGMRVGVGAGLTVPGGGYVFWPGNWPGRNEIITVDRKVYGTYLTAGVELMPQIRLGGGLVYYRTTEHLIQGLNFLNSAPGQIELGTTGGALSYDLSIELQPLLSVPFTIGFDYKHQGVQPLSGHAHGTNVPLALQPKLLDQGVTHTLTYPNQLNLAAAYRVIAPLLLTFDWTWERFHVYKQDLFVGDRGVTVVVPRDYKNGYTLRVGAEYQVIPLLKLRAGALRDMAPSRPETISPTLPDADSTAVTVGVGLDLTRSLEISASYFHDWEDKMTSVGGGAFPAQYDTRANIWALSISWKPGSATK